VRHHSDSPYKYSEADIKGMFGFIVDNTYVVFGDQVFQQSVGILKGTNCALLLEYLFLHSYEAEFVQKLSRDNDLKLAEFVNHTFTDPGIFYYISETYPSVPCKNCYVPCR
jgi:hypothetical protein